jgi:hypothetical protein
MTTRPATRKPTPAKPKAAPAAKAQTLAELAADVVASVAILPGLRATLEEIAAATGAYYRALRENQIPEDMAREFVGNWQASLWPTPEPDEHFEPDDRDDAYA